LYVLYGNAEMAGDLLLAGQLGGIRRIDAAEAGILSRLLMEVEHHFRDVGRRRVEHRARHLVL